MSQEQERVRFIRKGGRVIPIRSKAAGGEKRKRTAVKKSTTPVTPVNQTFSYGVAQGIVSTGIWVGAASLGQNLWNARKFKLSKGKIGVIGAAAAGIGSMGAYYFAHRGSK